MQIALGFIETNSFYGSVEAANVMLKAADIILLGKESFSTGVITVKIMGEIEAVKTAVKAGVQSMKNLDINVSSHIISEPDEQLISMIPEISNFYFHLKKASKENDKQKIISVPAIEKEIVSQESIVPKAKKIEVEKKSKSEKPAKSKEKIYEKSKKPGLNYKNDTIERLRKEALGLDSLERKKEEEKETRVKNDEKQNPSLESLNVHRLRKLARSTKDFPIQGREISRANRETLLNYFKKL